MRMKCYCPCSYSSMNPRYMEYSHHYMPYTNDIIGQHNTNLTVDNNTSTAFGVYWIGMGVAPQCATGIQPPFIMVCAYQELQPGQSATNKMAGYANTIGLVDLSTNQVCGYNDTLGKGNFSMTISEILNNSGCAGWPGTVMSAECFMVNLFGKIPGISTVFNMLGWGKSCSNSS